MNSATAHLVNEGDEVLVASYRFFDIEAEEKTKSASVVLCGKGNEIEKIMEQKTKIKIGDFDKNELGNLVLEHPKQSGLFAYG